MRYVIFVCLVLGALASYAQNKEQLIMPNVYIRFYDFDRYRLMPDPSKELKNYSADYSQRLKAAVNKVLSEPKFDFIYYPTTADPVLQNDLDSLSGRLFDEYGVYMVSGHYKKQSRIKPPPPSTINTLSAIGARNKTDKVFFLNIEGHVKEKPDKNGVFDKDAKGLLYIRGYILDIETGRILYDFLEVHPRTDPVSPHSRQKLDVLEDRILEKMVYKYLIEFRDQYLKFNKKHQSKKAK